MRSATRSLYKAILRPVAIVLICAPTSCSSSKSLVQKAAAYATYYEASYVRKCVDVVGPPTCQPCRNAINDAADLKDANGKIIRQGMIPLAVKVAAIGPLPKREVLELEDLVNRLEQCP